jgi:LacI family transcriptional regulator, galactose operon repressor
VTKRHRTTLVEVAERAGVSLTTASKAINGKNRVSAETRARVMAAARELSFTPSPIARGLTGGRTSTVGLIVADSMTHRFAVPIMLGAEAALSEIDLSMITCDARGDQARSLELAQMLAARRVDGMLIVGDNNAITASVTRQVDVPVVYVYGESDRAGDVVHMPDDAAGIGLAVDHLAAIGRRRIVHLTGPGHATAVAHRVAGLSGRLRQHQLELAAPVSYGVWSQRWARAAATGLLRQVPGIDAMLCGSDQIASGVLVALDELGLRVPDDVAVTGYDNWDVFALETEPQLTTVDMNLEVLGAAAARDLFTIIDGARPRGGIRRHPCELVIRGSTVRLPGLARHRQRCWNRSPGLGERSDGYRPGHSV